MRFGYAIEYDFAPPTQLQTLAGDASGPVCSSRASSTGLPVMRKPPRKG